MKHKIEYSGRKKVEKRQRGEIARKKKERERTRGRRKTKKW